MALVSDVLVFGSILAHEVAHALEAEHRGLVVKDISLHVFGGATRVISDVTRPGDAFALTFVGPWTSVVLGCGFGLLAHSASLLGSGHVAEVLGQLGWFNVLLGVFNLLPGVPLDGGRLLEAMLWKITRSRERATFIAAAVGQLIGLSIAGLGFVELLAVYGGFVSGLWLLVIGLFLVTAAKAERRDAVLRRALVGVMVKDLPLPPLAGVPVGTPLAEGVASALRFGQVDALGVVDIGKMVGVVEFAVVERIERDVRRQLCVEDVMDPIAELDAVDEDAPATQLLSLLDSKPVLIRSDRRVVNFVTSERLLRAMSWLGHGGDVAIPPSARSPSPSRDLRGPRPFVPIALWCASSAVILASLVVVPIPLLEVAPGPAIDLPSTLTTSGPRHDVNGRLLMTSVTITSPSALEAARTLFEPDHELFATTSVVPAGVDPDVYDALQRQLFQDATRLAAAVALRAANYRVAIRGGGAIVQAIGSGSPADGRLRTGDVITAINGQAVANTADLIARLQAASAGEMLRLSVVRDGRTILVDVVPQVSDPLGRPALGVGVEDAMPFVTLPFAIRSTRTDVGGPSAGLMTALAVYAITTGVDITRGQIIAGTGTIDANGTVGQVGGVRQKVVAAMNEGATIFLAPTADANAARQVAAHHRMRIVAVKSFRAALTALGAAAPTSP